MKKLAPAVILLLMAACPPPSSAFLDYLFSGSASRDAIDNSAIGDLRAWWTGNPAYQFNPWYTPSQPGAAPGAGQQQQPMQQQGSYSVTPPQTGYQQQQQPMYQGYAGQEEPQAMPQAYQTPQAMPQPVYQQPPQQYQSAPQQYQPPQYQTQAAPQYQQQYPAPQGQYQYPAPQYQGAPQGYQPMGQQ